jgi:DNA-binding NarL/FixJ family response regulator
MIKVLLVDAPAVARHELRVAMEAEPDLMLVGQAADPHDAVTLVWRHKPDVVVMVWSLSQGVGAIQAMHDQTTGTRIVVLTAHRSPDVLFELLQAGAHGLLLTDTASSAVIDAIRAVFCGGAIVGGDAAALMIPHYINRSWRTPSTAPLAGLSRRERQVLGLVVDGKARSEIAQQLAITPRSVDAYRSRLMKKLGATDLPALVKLATQHDLVLIERT